MVFSALKFIILNFYSHSEAFYAIIALLNANKNALFTKYVSKQGMKKANLELLHGSRLASTTEIKYNKNA